MKRFSNVTLVLALTVLVLTASLALIVAATFMIRHMDLPQIVFPTND